MNHPFKTRGQFLPRTLWRYAPHCMEHNHTKRNYMKRKMPQVFWNCPKVFLTFLLFKFLLCLFWHRRIFGGFWQNHREKQTICYSKQHL